MKRGIVTSLAAGVAAVTVGACGASTTPSPSASGTFSSTVLVRTPAGSIGSNWVKWNTKTCQFEAVASHPTTWVAELRKVNKPLVLGYGEQGTGNPLLDAMNANMQADAAKTGITLAIGNYDTLTSANSVVPQAQDIAVRKPKAVISFNVLASTIPTVNAMYEKLCAPVIQVTEAAPNTVVFGASNADVGKTEGNYLANYAKQQGWDPSTITILGAEDPALGTAIGERITDCESTAQAALSGATVDNLPSVNSTTADAQVKMTDWLTAHPNAHHILGCTIADIFGIGMANALTAAGRASNGVIMGAGGGSDAITEIKNGTPLIGSVDFEYNHYGDYLMSLAEDILDGQAVPAVVHQQLVVLDKSNVS